MKNASKEIVVITAIGRTVLINDESAGLCKLILKIKRENVVKWGFNAWQNVNIISKLR